MIDTTKQFEDMESEDLQNAVAELKLWDETGVLDNGKIREMANNLSEQVGMATPDALRVCRDGVLREAAFRWLYMR